MFEIVKGTKIDFMGKVKLFAILSTAVILISLATMFTKGFNYGIDFAGGTIIQARFAETPSLDKMRDTLGAMDLGDVVIQTFGEPNDVLIRVEKSKDADLQKVSSNIQQQLYNNFGGKDKVIIERVEQVGPQVGDELKNKAYMAVLYALIGVLIYIAFRFQFIFAVGAVIALFHDVLITLGVFSLVGKEINLPIIAAVLTIVGYSLNDTIVVFDRVRENLKEAGDKLPLKDVINQSLNETLSRTLLTSLTTLLAVASLYLFGGEVINGFAFALLLGVLVGTYSSIGIASAYVYTMKMRKKSA